LSPGTPDFFDLVGDEGSPEELEQLRRTHDLLVAAGPPPELSPRLADVPVERQRSRSSAGPRRRTGTAFLLAAGVAAAAFGIGFLVGGRGSSDFQAERDRTAQMHPASGSGLVTAGAVVEVGTRDEVGNWPLRVRVSGLKPLPQGEWYELYLTRGGKITAWCGAFSVKDRGRTTVQFSVPYRLKNAGWVVTNGKRQLERQVLLTT
jgi:hypothetical protein